MNKRILSVYLILFCALILMFILNLGLGSVRIPAGHILDILFRGAGSENESSIIREIRLPRAEMAILVGGALSLSGFMLQTFFANPIAGPYILGISSGAKMAVAVVLICFAGSIGRISSWSLIFAAFVGAMASTGLILLASLKIRSMAALLLAGVMTGYIFSAVTELLITFAGDQDIVNLHGWSLGSLSGTDSEGAAVAAVTVLSVAFAVFLLSKPMNAYLLGEDYAGSMGVNIRLFQIVLIVLSSILSATATAFAGPVSFVGIAVPYLTRKSLGTGRPLFVIPASFLCGALLCLICDLISRMLFAPTEISLSTVTAFFGAPVVIRILVHRKEV